MTTYHFTYETTSPLRDDELNLAFDTAADALAALDGQDSNPNDYSVTATGSEGLITIDGYIQADTINDHAIIVILASIGHATAGWPSGWEARTFRIEAQQDDR